MLDDVIVVVRVGNGVRGGPEVETFVTDRCGRRRQWRRDWSRSRSWRRSWGRSWGRRCWRLYLRIVVDEGEGAVVWVGVVPEGGVAGEEAILFSSR